jgi:hypothetical protein
MTATRRNAIKLKKTNDYDLKRSEENLGPLYPILKDSEGRVIDGIHRELADKNWPTLTLDNISGIKTLISRLVVNVQRRKVPSDEKRKMLSELFEATNWTPEQIAEHTGMSVSWVRKYLPQEFKNLEMSALASKKLKSNTHPCPKCSSSMILLYGCTECGEMHSTQIITKR